MHGHSNLHFSHFNNKLRVMALTVTIFVGGDQWLIVMPRAVVSLHTDANLFCCGGMAVDCFLVFNQKNVSNLPDLFLSTTTSYSQSVFTAT